MIKAVFAIPPEVHLLDVNEPTHIFYEAKDRISHNRFPCIQVWEELVAIF